ncbi:hypothetical protein A2V71_01780 [Candidatus Berkelbacteria bacterium RBG_13_40_8]|uniref:Radical SAM core domain-containing protein n=1 Tax=Candidatus Berkelbacteria bacterium RBG_13_40_8 TaxID=1797467 RepID=A0A1F5DPS5_9BACT|nr:MAG: hypothetical protein A2V71_01780 [Candidatus Berkelbacteria bacterium RBG_13_40_8]
MLSKKVERSFVYHGLPCIWTGKVYAFFDPANLKMAIFKDQASLSKTKIKDLEIQGFKLDPQPVLMSNLEKQVTLILTTDCNLACPYCYTRSKVNPTYLDANVAISILKTEVPTDRRLYLQYFGGEPTLNFDCIQAVTEFAKSRYPDLFIYITTNGVMSQEVLDYLIRQKIGFYLSLDGTKEFNDKFRRTRDTDEGTFDQVMQTLRSLLKYDIPVKIRSTVTENNLENMIDFASEMFRQGVKLIHFCPKTDIGRGSNVDQGINDEDYQNRFIGNLETVLDLAKESSARVITPATLAIGKPFSPYCKILQTENKILITPEGKRTLCYGTQDEYHPESHHFVCADYRPDQDILVPRPGVVEKVLETYRKNSLHCSDCFAQFMCQGGCMAENLALTGDMAGFNDRWCQMQKKLWHFTIERIFRSSRGE